MEAQVEDEVRDKESQDQSLAAGSGEEKKLKKSKKAVAKEETEKETKQQEVQKDESDKKGKRGQGSGKGSSSDEEKSGKGGTSEETSTSLKEGGNEDGDKKEEKKLPEGDGSSKKKKTLVRITKRQATTSGKNGDNKPKKDNKEDAAVGPLVRERFPGLPHQLLPEKIPEKKEQEGRIVLGRMTTFPRFLQKYEKSKGMVYVGPPLVIYKVLLRCMSRNSEEHRELAMWNVPKTGADIKVRGGGGSDG